MTSHTWHIEHEDGSRWTDYELNELYDRLDCHDIGEVLFPAIDNNGNVVLVTKCTRPLTVNDNVIVVDD